MANQGKHARIAGYWSGRKRVGDSAWGRHMRRVKGAKHANEAIRASGRVPGEEGRRVIAAKRARKVSGSPGSRFRGNLDMSRSATSLETKARENEPVYPHLPHSSNLSPSAEKDNRLLLQKAEETEKALVEHNRREWAAKQARLHTDAPQFDAERVGRANVEGI